MTLKLRNNLFILGLILGGALSLLYAAGMGILLVRFPREVPLEALLLRTSSLALQSLLPLLLLNIFLFTSGLVLYLTFRKTSSAEIFFFFIFLMATGCEGFRLGLFYIKLFDLPFQLGMNLSRIIFFGRFFGTLCLFAAGLFACGIPYQRLELMLGGCFLVALSLATTIPLDSGIQGANLIYSNGLAREFLLGMVIVEALGVGNLLYAVHLHNNPNYYFLAGGMTLVMISKGVLFYLGGGIILYAIGFLGLILGTIIFGNKTHEVYLWF